MTMTNPIDTSKVYIGAGLISGIGALLFTVMPAFVGAMAESLQFSESQLGDVIAIFNVGFTATAISAIYWIQRARWRLTSGVAVVCAAVIFSSMAVVQSFPAIALLALLLGVSLGALYALILAILGESAQPDRAFGVKLGLETLPGIAMLFLLPAMIVPIYGFSGAVLTLAALTLLVGAATTLLPRGSVKTVEEARHSGNGQVDKKPVWMPALALTSSLLFFTGIAATWAFLERLAAVRGLSSEPVGAVLSIGLIIAGLGGFVAAGIGDRWGRLFPLLAVSLVNLAGLWALFGFSTVVGYALGACAFLFTVNFALAYTFGLTAEVDIRGRFVVLSAAALSVGGIIGPGIGGRLLEFSGFGALLAFSAVCMLTSFLSYFSVTRQLPSPAG
jgi:predicted MFS family arabinose efflux permease